MHPLTPLFRGGLVLVIVAGVIIANLRDRIIYIFIPDEFEGEVPEDPVDFVLENNLILLALLAVLAAVILLIAVFYVMWRFHSFRITGDDVEVRSGVLFRTHRRAPLDRVQGVNLTRPMVARLFGLAKLEVVGAGLDSNVKLEYLSTSNAEEVRADILRLASGTRLAEARATDASAPATSRVSAAASAMSAGITGLIEGAEAPVDEPESVVDIPVGRLILSHLLSGGTIGLIFAIAVIIAGAILGTPWVLFGMIPAVIGFGAYWFRSITRSLRYSIAPTPSGVRITFGLFTTITEILPPGRIHAVQISQSILWRPTGWWTVTVNRLSGRGLADVNQDQFSTVLPVGTRADVERVLRLLLPTLPESEWPLVFEHGVLGPAAADPYTNTPRRARLLRLFSWRRNGFDLTADALFLRRGAIWRSLAVFPLARLQSVGIDQGPLDRALGVASLQAHTIAGRVSGSLGIIDRDDALAVFEGSEAGVIAATASDRSHRWAGGAEHPSEPRHDEAEDTAAGETRE
jgi:putative membrane protein